jgi:hypothetical protein
MSLAENPRGRPLYIGSLPMEDHKQALQEVLNRTPETPHWVQLPANPPEGFLVQFCETFPGLRMDQQVVIDRSSSEFETDYLSFYEDYLAVLEGQSDLGSSRFTVSPQAAPGLYLLGDLLPSLDPWVVKGQVSGPLTVLLGINDEAGRCAYYDERLRDAMVKMLTLKARWQTGFLSRGGRRAVVFVDEPALGGLGSSAYISISTEAAMADLREILRGIRDAGGWAGVHVCANADWDALLETGPDLLSFDAFSYFDRIVLYREKVLDFLDRAGKLAWGIVPTDPMALDKSSPEDLAERWHQQAEELSAGKWSPKDLLAGAFVTPSCGLGSVTVTQAKKAMDLTVQVSGLLRAHYGLA